MLITKNEFGQVHKTPLSPGLFALVIEHLTVKAKVSLHGGQVLSWHPNGERDVFWLSKKSIFDKDKAIRGGIPLCWPWFGVHPNDKDNTAGNHGFARTQQWQVDNIHINEAGVEVILSWQGENIHRLWPHACQLKQILFFGHSFKQTLHITNLSHVDTYYASALHSYFAVSSPKAIKVADLEQASFYNKLTDRHCQPQPLNNGVGPVDRIYYTNNVMNLIDMAWGRTLRLKSYNAKQWVFWNPGATLARTMVDIQPYGEQEFVCLEAANTDMALLAAGQSTIIKQEISILSHKP